MNHAVVIKIPSGRIIVHPLGQGASVEVRPWEGSPTFQTFQRFGAAVLWARRIAGQQGAKP